MTASEEKFQKCLEAANEYFFQGECFKDLKNQERLTEILKRSMKSIY